MLFNLAFWRASEATAGQGLSARGVVDIIITKAVFIASASTSNGLSSRTGSTLKAITAYHVLLYCYALDSESVLCNSA